MNASDDKAHGPTVSEAASDNHEVSDYTQPAPRHTQESAKLLNIANVLTVIRIVFIPVFVWLLLRNGGESAASRWLALLMFIALMVTDFVDGRLARSRNLITDFGKIADPSADKALMISALVGLNIIGHLWWWVTCLIVIREIGITLWRMAMLHRGLVVPASKGGKLKTALQSLAVSLFLMPLPGWTDWLTGIVMAAAVIVTVVTGIQYLLDSRQSRAALSATTSA